MTYKQLLPMLRWQKCQIRRRGWDPRISVRSTAFRVTHIDGRSYERSRPAEDIKPYLSVPAGYWDIACADGRTGNQVMADLVAGDHDDWVICAWDGTDALTQYPFGVATHLLSIGYELRRLDWPSTCRLRRLTRGGGDNPYRIYGTITKRTVVMHWDEQSATDWVVAE